MHKHMIVYEKINAHASNIVKVRKVSLLQKIFTETVMCFTIFFSSFN